MIEIDTQALGEFIVKARRHGWLEGGQPAQPNRPGSTRFVFDDGDWHYEDEYEGGERFQGREVVLHKGKVVWGMVYNGNVEPEELIKAGVSMEETYAFLKDALGDKVDQVRTGTKDTTRYFNETDFYEDNPWVDSKQFEDFSGVEFICMRGCIVYSCNYHGGFIR